MPSFTKLKYLKKNSGNRVIIISAISNRLFFFSDFALSIKLVKKYVVKVTPASKRAYTGFMLI